MRWFGRLRGHGRWEAGLAAYADGELPEAGAARFVGHLQACERCREALSVERALKEMLSATLPVAPAPRSFAITPAMLALQPRPQPALARTPRLAMRMAQAAAGVAIIGLIGLFVVDLGGSGEDGRSGAAAPMAAGDDASSTGEEAAGSSAPRGTPGNEATAESGSLPSYDTGGVSGQGAESPAPDPTAATPQAKSIAGGATTATGNGAGALDGGEREGEPLRRAGDGSGRDWMPVARISLVLVAAGAVVAYLAIRTRVRR
ncbi:MAG: zf-HC2 domain-containing protein [Dehalococcoidia bacterium]|nr:hypothetical protein [Chloroflexi bacterium CFX7]MCK6563768.1 zf-HC2 domain-containing protein [Dehalococcoidia bacterium]NUQ55198.1 zf-HC2 domain-containing protein [Dehalococcoidia bacterium]RIL04015.1 MAG: hypothetical protein DCC78_00015 [bacterium]